MGDPRPRGALRRAAWIGTAPRPAAAPFFASGGASSPSEPEPFAAPGRVAG